MLNVVGQLAYMLKKVADILLKVREVAELGELDALIVKQPLI
jgi:hypothetical protein